MKAAELIDDEWVKTATAKGANGKQLLEVARAGQAIQHVNHPPGRWPARGVKVALPSKKPAVAGFFSSTGATPGRR